ncbi:hypothetical protein [Nocardia wallacei]|uniref:hypothetical protein n=1 Tax=Nocardia wallacei TaxID=480035 RepID=UPI002454349C|nr:hypothetical protein [Nocardia wallacei]
MTVGTVVTVNLAPALWISSHARSASHYTRNIDDFADLEDPPTATYPGNNRNGNVRDMPDPAWCDSYVRAVERACVSTAETLARETGRPASPQLHMFLERPDPYVGCVTCRPVQGSDNPEAARTDAYLAISGLEVAAAATGATRLLFVWEHADMRTSLNGPGNYETALVTVDADRINHTLTWRPFTPHPTNSEADGGRSFQLSWGPVGQLDNPDLMKVPGNPIGMALWNWRRGVQLDLEVLDDMRLDGYIFHWRTSEFTDRLRHSRGFTHERDSEPGGATIRPIYFGDF